MVFGPVLDKMVNEGKTSKKLTKRFSQELLKVQEEVREREKKERKNKKKRKINCAFRAN